MIFLTPIVSIIPTSASMALNLKLLYLLPPQDLLSSYQLSQPVAIELHQALTQFQQALSGEESLQVVTIMAALNQLTSVEVNPLAEFVTGTNLKCQQAQEFDRYMQIQHVHTKEPANLIVVSLLTAYLAFCEISQCLSFNVNQYFVKYGFQSYVFLLQRIFNFENKIDNKEEIYNNIFYSHHNNSTQINTKNNHILSPLEIWKKGHWVFLIFSQGLILSLNRFVTAMSNDQLDLAKIELETAAELMYASGAAMKLTGNFTREKYETEIRPTMIIGNPQSLVQSENLSGLMMWDHDYLINVICKQKLLPIMKNLPSRIEAEHKKFLLAYKWGLSDGHKSICAEFGGGEQGSLIDVSESSNAINKLKNFEKSRAKLFDPTGQIKDSCPLKSDSIN